MLPTAAPTGGVFSVLDFGAKGDGVTYDTAAVRKAAAALREAGGGELLFPAGKRVLTAPFNLSSNSILTVGPGATVLCSARGQDYDLVEVLPWIPFSSAATPGFWPQPCVYFDGGAEGRYPDGGHNITIQGPGTIDGQGKGWWECASPPKGASWEECCLAPPCLTSPPYPAPIVANKYAIHTSVCALARSVVEGCISFTTIFVSDSGTCVGFTGPTRWVVGGHT
jgi:hypothetical protein